MEFRMIINRIRVRKNVMIDVDESKNGGWGLVPYFIVIVVAAIFIEILIYYY